MRLAAKDLEQVFVSLNPIFEQLRGRRLFVTGGTGIIGKWLLETLADADRRLGLDASVVVLTRSVDRFRASAPHIATWSGLSFVEGDVRSFEPPCGPFDAVIHGATDVVDADDPLNLFNACVDGTRRVANLALHAGARDFLLLSSGAVYGVQPDSCAKMPESWPGGPDTLAIESAYAEGKRASEWLSVATAHQSEMRAKSARLYALVGPYLPLDRHFAIGNFIGDALAGRTIVVQGDGTTIRSYLHLSDVTIWLWTILINGRHGCAYNVGSETGISTGELAQRVAHLLDAPGVDIRGRAMVGLGPRRYVPDTSRAQSELGLASSISLDEAICRTAEWHRPTETK